MSQMNVPREFRVSDETPVFDLGREVLDQFLRHSKGGIPSLCWYPTKDGIELTLEAYVIVPLGVKLFDNDSGEVLHFLVEEQRTTLGRLLKRAGLQIRLTPEDLQYAHGLYPELKMLHCTWTPLFGGADNR